MGNKPDYTVASPVKQGDGDKIFWQNIGAGWQKEKGISISLNALPLTKDIMLFPYTEKKDAQ